uniref:hypothetical protein n=1 Tax=Candidatus Electronema sp. TaxID=2698783 RepID=UPI004055C417
MGKPTNLYQLLPLPPQQAVNNAAAGNRPAFSALLLLPPIRRQNIPDGIGNTYRHVSGIHTSMFWRTYWYIPVIHTGMFHQYIPVCIFAALLIRRRAATRRQGGSKALPPAFLTPWRKVFRTCIAAQTEEYSLLYARNMPAAFL